MRNEFQRQLRNDDGAIDSVGSAIAAPTLPMKREQEKLS